MSGPEDFGGERLRALVERIERMEEEIAARKEDMKELFAEAKGDGFDVKILKEVVRLRKQDADERDEHQSLLETYMAALNTAAPAVAKAA